MVNPPPANNPQSTYISANQEISVSKSDLQISTKATLMDTDTKNKDAKVQILLDYAKECHKNGHKPTKREIRAKFHVEIYNYFRSIADYHKKAGIILSVRSYSKEEARKIIIGFLHKNAKKDYYPTRKEIEKELKINFSTYFIDLKELYDKAYVEYGFVEQSIRNKILASNTHSPSTLIKQKESIQKLIQQKAKDGYYPSVQYLQHKLSLSFYNLYKDIIEAYKDAGVDYERVSPIILGKKKELVFTQIVKELLQKMEFKIQRVSIESEREFNRNADMTVINKDGKTLLVEIKAYREDYCIARREFNQLERYLNKENIKKGLVITTSNSKKCLFNNIQLINGTSVLALLKTHNLHQHIPAVKWIQESRVNTYEKQSHDTRIRNKIINYAKSKKRVPSKKEIEKMFKIDLRTYFGDTKPYNEFLNQVSSS